MANKRVKISSIVENQLPSFIRDDFPLLSEFLSQYYLSVENQGGPVDLLQNIDQYIKVDEITNLTESTILINDVDYQETSINVASTYGFPDSYGLIQIDSEILTYTSKTDSQFIGCIRGFSGITSHRSLNSPDQLVFSQSEVDQHFTGSEVKNLSILFLKEFAQKVKQQFSPGFDSRQLVSGLNENVFIKQSQDFYSTKGTDESFRILFGALYGEPCEIIKPRENLLNPSNSDYQRSQKLVIESITGNPLDLVNLTIRQDKNENFKKASGVVKNVEKILKGEREYYILSLDYNYDINQSPVFSQFSVHPKTKTLKSFTTLDTIIDVDSTIGFPKSGNLKTILIDGREISISYQNKSINQFLECAIEENISLGQELRLDDYAYYLDPRDPDKKITFRICSIISGANIIDGTSLFKVGDTGKIQSFGVSSENLRDNNWLFNISVSYEVKKIEKVNNVNFTCNITTYDKNIFLPNDSITLFLSDGTEIIGTVFSILNKNVFQIKDIGNIDISRIIKVRRNISKPNFFYYSKLNNYTSNIQNVYSDYVSTYITSNSLPDYSSSPVRVNTIYLSGTLSGESVETFNDNGSIISHGFKTGDAIYYDNQSDVGISSGIYFIKKIDDTTIKLSKSRSNLFDSKYVSFSGAATNNPIYPLEHYNKTLKPQKIIRKISEVTKTSNKYETSNKPIGILVNGVEISNYKSNNFVYHGGIEEINVLSPGSGYDVINPPNITITDLVGIGATSFCEVEGHLDRIDVIDSGFDYLDTPVITIIGGNGYGALAKANLITFQHAAVFNSTSNANLVDLSNNTVAFSTYHKFRNAESVIYETDDQDAISGLSTGSVYYVCVKNDYTVTIHNSSNEAAIGINTINLTQYGKGNHRFISSVLKKKVGSISIENKGSLYRNRKIIVEPVGINTASDIVFAKNHRYLSGDIISYSYNGTNVGGLSTTSYYVTKISSDEFKLSQIGVGNTNKDFYYQSRQFVDFTSQGSGEHIFNHEPISVSISGYTGITTANFSTSAVLQPIFRGSIKSIYVSNGGSNYGSSEIINYNRQPNITISSGTKAQLEPVVNNGKITQVIVKNSGSGYTQIPDLIILGTGEGSSLTPIIENGVLTEVKVINGGVGYESESTEILVVPVEYGCSLISKIKSWQINLFEKLLLSNQIYSDDGVITNSINDENELQYTHLYSPRLLREKILASKYINGELNYVPDLRIQNNQELNSDAHSPIIGWAYDGNPIYGPYAYSNPEGRGFIKQMSSGYELIKEQEISSNRPSQTIFPLGFFIEDYVYRGNSDLDEYNGRFCVTPDYPKGVYAYFSTINNSIESEGPFKNFKKPIFPYFIGNKYNSIPINFNFETNSTQNDFDFETSPLLRNTTPYGLTEENTSYDFLLDKKYLSNSNLKVSHTSTGSINSIGIVTGGSNYSVGDPLVFDDRNSGGSNAFAYVSILKGKPINTIQTESRSIDNVEFYSNGLKSLIGFSTTPHNLTNNTVINISGISTNGFYLQDNYSIGVKTDVFVLTNAVGDISSTGIVTYFSINGNLSFPNIRENDILGIGTEKIKVLSVDKTSSRIRIIRGYDGTVGSSHTFSSVIIENPRKFNINVGFSTSGAFNVNKQIYFDPSESIGVGTISGVGIGTTLTFSNPGVGITQIFVPTKSIYLPNHKLNTGDKLIYNSNGGTRLSISTDGISSYQLSENQLLYAAKLSSDLIGIATERVGLGSTGFFVGINSTTNVSTVYITGLGTGAIHSFKTDYDKVLSGKVNSNIVTVSTASTHGLEDNDRVLINVKSGITTTVVVKYNDYHRRLVVNPRDFSSSGINTSKNQITINNHNYYTGKKLIHTSTSPAGGLVNNTIYYAIVDDENIFRLTDNHYQTSLLSPNVVDITSTSSGTLSEVNPEIKITENQTVIFDLSDSSLSYQSQLTTYSAFDFNLYTDFKFKNKFESISSKNFDVVKVGRIGIDADAKLTLFVSDLTPTKLYYSLDPIPSTTNLNIKKEIINDSEYNQNSNLLSVQPSDYFGVFNVTGIGSTTFKFNISRRPEQSLYTINQGLFEYKTNSKSALGEVSEINVISNGRGYKSLPGISSIFSETGTGCVVNIFDDSIGKVKKVEIENFGFDYPSDPTLALTGRLPIIVKLTAFSSFEKIGISSVGKYYTKAPNLVTIDTLTNQVLSEVDLVYSLQNQEVLIRNNAYGIYENNVKFIPINNSNGIGIKSITYDPATKDVTVGLAATYSTGNVFPFQVGDKVIIENTSVGVGSTGKGYNSENYGYSLFTLTQVTPQFGGSGASVKYNLTEYLGENEVPGKFNTNLSAGIITPEKYFPIFAPTFKKNNFRPGEVVFTDSATGVVEVSDGKNNYMKISSFNNFEIDQIIEGRTSKSRAKIEDVKDTRIVYSMSSSVEKIDGWKNSSGFLNDESQRIQDSDYYQNMSYSIKSRVPIETWNEPVSTLNHTLGFKKFSDLVIESTPSVGAGMSTNQDLGDVSGICDIFESVDLNCYYDFDLVTENSLEIGTKLISDQVFFKSKILQDYVESVGNRVLIVDNFSDSFNNTPRSTVFSVISSFNINSARFLKYLTFVRDKRFSHERQVSLFTLLQDGTNAFINEYAKVYTVEDLGTFDFDILGSEGRILFYPIYYEVNDYDISLLSFNLEEVYSGIGTTSIGNVVQLQTSAAKLPVGLSTSANLIGISSSYRASKFLVSIASTNGSYYETNELTAIHNGSDVFLLEYGKTNNNLVPSSSGLGTYSAEIIGSNLNIDFYPNAGLGVSFYSNTLAVSIGNSSFVGTGSTVCNTSEIKSGYTSIAASGSPTKVGIITYSTEKYNGAYLIVSVEDLTNNRYQVSEITVVDDDTTPNIVEYGVVESDTSLGSFDADISGSFVEIGFTPIANSQIEVRTFMSTIGLATDSTLGSVAIDMNQSSIEGVSGRYFGTSKDLKKQFDLTHSGYSIFERSFRGDLTSVVNTTKNTISLPNHFFVTGEKLAYSNSGTPIGIATTTVPGIGSTDLLPSNVYVVKIDNSNIKLTASAENALLTVPDTFDIVAVGVGTSHSFVGFSQNQRVLISIDNVIQSPVVSTAITTHIIFPVLTTDDSITVAGITSFFGGDLIKIDQEIMQITRVGFGSTNVFAVRRPSLGTDLELHSINSKVTKVNGNFNIVRNQINFAEAPYGLTPISSTTNPPSERDFEGISTHSTFDGRIFLRSGLIGSTESTYDRNYIFDDISNNFTGVTTSFTLSSNESPVSGIVTSNAIVLINQIFQQPRRSTSPVFVSGNYYLNESAGITSIFFTGSTPPASVSSYDIQSSNVPVGGLIVSVGSSQGFGYQPLVSAGGTAVVSTAGTIQSIGIGSAGSGYRASSVYEISADISSPISVGSTIIYLENSNSIFSILNLLNTGSNCSIGVGTFIGIGSVITSVGSTFITVGTSATTSYTIPSGTQATVKISNPSIGIVNVGIATSTVGITSIINVGYSTVNAGRLSSTITITNPGSGYTSTNPPIVVFDDPLSYSDIPLVYSSSSSGIGTGATIDITVGQGSSVINFEIKNYGYGYGQGQVLTVPFGGITGIPTNLGLSFEEFKITVEKTYEDSFVGWSVGDLESLDDISDLFDGVRKSFQLKFNGEFKTIRSKKGSDIDIESTLLIFHNDILQVPNVAYNFDGGSIIDFVEAPKEGDTCKIIFYKGTGGVDVVDVDILETVKKGDDITLYSDNILYREEERTVNSVDSSNIVKTNVYSGVGINTDETFVKSVTWCRQTEDKFIDGKPVTKDRTSYEPLIQPTTNIIADVGVTTNILFVESVKTFFDSSKENTSSSFIGKLKIVSQKTLVSASATAVVSGLGTISSIVISDGGVGYTTSPTVTIENPVGLGTTQRSEASSTISVGGTVSSIIITNPGTGYTSTTPPVVLIESPSSSKNIENVTASSFSGDFGIISGINTTSIGIASTALVFDFYIPNDSFLRDSSIVGTAITISGIQTGFYFIISESNVGNGVTSLNSSNSVVGVGTSFLDNIYYASSVSIGTTSVLGIGLTQVAKVTVNLTSYNNLTGLGYSNFYGRYSWGKINLNTRIDAKEFISNKNGISGISTSPTVERINPLKYFSYNS